MNLHRPRSFHSSRGATLLELLVYVAIIGLTLTTATYFAIVMVGTQAKAAALAEVVRNARFALSRIEIEVREAADLNTGASVFGSDPGTLSLATSTGATDPTIFTVASGVLTVQQGAGSAIPLTNSKVEVLEFTVENVGTVNKTKAVRVHLKLRSTDSNDLVEQRAETTVESTVRIHAKDGFGN